MAIRFDPVDIVQEHIHRPPLLRLSYFTIDIIIFSNLILYRIPLPVGSM